MLTVIGQSLSSGHAHLGLPHSSTLHFLGSLHFTSAQGSETAWIKVSLTDFEKIIITRKLKKITKDLRELPNISDKNLKLFLLSIEKGKHVQQEIQAKCKFDQFHLFTLHRGGIIKIFACGERKKSSIK